MIWNGIYFIFFEIRQDKLESLGISILGTRMNTDYQDIKSFKKPNTCENLCPNLTRLSG